MTEMIVNSLLGGGIVSVVFSVLSLRWRVRKEREESRRLGLINAETATDLLLENIVEPLKRELNDTKREMAHTKVELQRLRRAIQVAHHCRYSPDCPVLHRMWERTEGVDGGHCGTAADGDLCRTAAGGADGNSAADGAAEELARGTRSW